LSVSFVIVTYNNSDALKGSLPALAEQLRAGDELVVVDNASADGSAETAERLVPGAMLIRNPDNAGFAAGCNRGAAATTGDLLVFLNPDAKPAPGFREAIERPATGGAGWGAWMGLVTMADGAVVNTSGGVVHFTGLAWAGQAGEPVEAAVDGPAEVGFVSGACFAIPRASYAPAGGFPEQFFMYCEDVDLSLRLRLRGERLGVVPDARVDHDYDFAKGALKWRLLERNRVATVIRTYPAALLLLLAPALIATEAGIFAAALAGGWAGQKLQAWGDVARAMPALLRERAAVQAERSVSAAEFAAWLTPELLSPYLPDAVRSAPVRLALRSYWRVVSVLLRSTG
jgi:GT2 family glycosyltransferase